MRIALLSLVFAVGSSTAPSAYAQQIGVPACDEYLTKYEACFSKQPEAARAATMQTIAQMRQIWSQLAANPQTRPQLEPVCKQTIEAAKAQLNVAPHNCGF